jgi:hypothetical protein
MHADDLTPAEHTAHLRADLEQDALEAAYGDEIRRRFGVLASSLSTQDVGEATEDEIVQRFRRGLAAVRRAWELAEKEL